MKISGNPWATVIGVAADTRYRELTAIRPTVYLPRAQFEAAPLFLAVRTALGAPKRVVLRAVLLEGAMMTLIGMLGGAAIAALFSGWLESILYGVSRHDPATIAGVALLVCLVTGVATYIPARRAASVEPTVALRS